MLSSLLITVAVMATSDMTLNAYLERAIDRGVPLYNAGQQAACAAIYATALEGVAHSTGWGLDDEQRDSLRYQLEQSAALEAADARAWAYRRLIDALLSEQPIAARVSSDTRVLFDFSDEAQINRWQVVLDGVMGGRSTGNVSYGEGSLIFTGETSLRNNGGFSSIRSLLPVGSMAGFDALRFRVKGDGRTWILGANANPGRRGSSFWYRFDTTDGEWVTVTVPIDEMGRQVMGTPVGGTLSPFDVRAVEFYIFDKQAGAFRLEVDRVEAVKREA